MEQCTLIRMAEMRELLAEKTHSMIETRLTEIQGLLSDNVAGVKSSLKQVLAELAQGKETGSIVISFLRSSYITGSHEFSITYYGGEPFVEEEPDGTCLDMRLLFTSVETDLQEIDHELEAQFLKVLPAEKETVHRWYLEQLYIGLGTVLEEVLAEIQKDDGMGVYYGGYMEELRMIGKVPKHGEGMQKMEIWGNYDDTDEI